MDDFGGAVVVVLIFVLACVGVFSIPFLFWSTEDSAVITQCKEKGYYYYDSKTKMVCSIEQ